MNIENKKELTSDLLRNLVLNLSDDSFLSLNEIKEALHERGFGLLMIIFSFPMAIPLPYPPGFTTILGMPLLFFSIQMICGREIPWLPEYLGKKSIKVSHLRFAIDKSNIYFKKIEKFLRPRLLMISSTTGERFIGFISLLCSLSIILPIWFGNAIPSAGIFIMSLGLLDRDGIFIIIGIITSIIGLIIASLVIWLGVHAVESLFLNLF